MGSSLIKLEGKPFRFIIAGIFVTSIYILIAYLAQKYVFDSLPIANAIAFILANIVSYFIHTIWSFSEAIKKKNLLKFYIVTLGAFGLSVLIPSLGQHFQINHITTIICTALVIPIFTFLLHLFWTYK